MTNSIDITSRRLVFLTSKIQCEHYKNHKQIEGDLIIPIGPEAMYEVVKSGWSAFFLGDLPAPRSFENDQEFVSKKLYKLIEALNLHSSQQDDKSSLLIGNYYAFQFWIIIGQIWRNYFLIKSLIEKFNPNHVVAYANIKQKIFLHYRPDPANLFADILKKICNEKKINQETIYSKKKQKLPSFREFIFELIPNQQLSWLRYLRQYLRVVNFKTTKYKLGLIGGGYDWLSVARNKNFNSLFKICPLHSPVSGVKFEPTLEVLSALQNAVSIGGNSIYDLSYLAPMIDSDLKKFQEMHTASVKKIKKFAAIITSCLSYPHEVYLAHMAEKSGVPMIVWQHGEKGQCNDPTILDTELRYATDYLCYAAGVKKIYDEWLGKNRLIDVSIVGSLGKKIEIKRAETILYASGKWFISGFPTLIRQDPDTRLFRAQKQILNYLDGLPTNHKIIFRPNNTHGCNAVPYQLLNVEIKFDKTFTELLANAKVVILDTPATTLVEACSTKIPIFILGGRSEYNTDFLRAIKKRAVWCETPSELILKLNSFIELSIYDANVNEEEYKNKFCASSDRDNVVDRLAKKIEYIIERGC